MKKYFFCLGVGISIVYAVNSLAVDYIEFCPEDAEDKSQCILEAMDEVAEFPKVEVVTNPSFSADLAVGDPVHEIKTEPGEQVAIELYANPHYTGKQEVKIQKEPRHGTVSQEDNILYYESNLALNLGSEKDDSFSYALIDPNGNKSPISTVKLVIAKPDLTDSQNIYNEIYATKVDPGLPTYFDIGANYDPTTQKLDLDPSFKSQIVDNGDGTLTYLPQPGFEGLDRFSYTVTHADGKKYTFLVKLEVGQVEEEEPKPVTKPKEEEPKPVEKPKEEEPKPVEKPKEEEPKPVEKPKEEEPKPVEKPKEEKPKPVVETEPSDNNNNNETNTVVVSNYIVSPSVYVDHYTTVHAEALLIIDISANVTARQPKVTINPSANSWVRYNKNGSLLYLSNPRFVGVDMFSYTVSDRQGKTSSTFTVKVVVEKKRPPKSIPLTTRKAYAVQDNDGSDSQFFTINPGDGSTSELGSPHKGLDIEGMAIKPLKNELYATSGQGQRNFLDGYLYRVDAETGDLTPVGDTGFSELAALSFRSDGTLWAGTIGPKNSNTKKKNNQGGIIKIDPQTAKSDLMFSFPWKSKKQKVEGLAWSLDGSVLYASENKDLWELNCQDWKKICSNFPGEVEALETLADGMLLFAVSNHGGHVASVYDPQTCTIVLDRPFQTAKYYSDVEAIVWPLESQFSLEIEDWDITFTKKPKREKQVCLKTVQQFNVIGEVKITPPESLAYIETYWHVTNAEEDLLSFTTKLGSATSQETDCNVIFPQQLQTITGGTTTFHFNGHWQGLSKKANKNVSIETHYGINLYDRERHPLSIEEIEKTLVLKGTNNACNKAKPN